MKKQRSVWLILIRRLLQRLSKALSNILQDDGLDMQDDGFAYVSEVIRALHFSHIPNLDDIKEVVRRSMDRHDGCPRFEIKEDSRSSGSLPGEQSFRRTRHC